MDVQNSPITSSPVFLNIMITLKLRSIPKNAGNHADIIEFYFMQD